MFGNLRRFWPLLILLPAAAFKFHVWTNTQPRVIARSSTYLQPATELLERGSYSGVETLRRTPSYPLFLALTLGISGGNLRAVTLIQHMLGLAIAFVMMRMALLLWDSRAAAIAVTLLISFHPNLVFYENSIESELLSVFLLSAMLLPLTKAIVSGEAELHSMCAAGLLGGAAALGRPELAVCAVIPPPFLMHKKGGWKPAACFFLSFTAPLAIWMYRNLAVFDYFALTPMGAVTSLQTSGPMIDWDAPTHREFKKMYAELLKKNGGSHLTVVNDTIGRLGRDPDFKTKRALIEAAKLGAETTLKHPLKYLWATRVNFLYFMRSIGRRPEQPAPVPQEPRRLGFHERHLLYLSLLGLAAASWSARSAGILFLFLSALGIMTANCVADMGTVRRSLAIIPILALFASYLCTIATAGLSRAWQVRTLLRQRPPAALIR